MVLCVVEIQLHETFSPTEQILVRFLAKKKRKKRANLSKPHLKIIPAIKLSCFCILLNLISKNHFHEADYLFHHLLRPCFFVCCFLEFILLVKIRCRSKGSTPTRCKVVVAPIVFYSIS